MSEMEITTGEEIVEIVRPIDVITEEILFYKRQAGRAFIEIGRRLNEAKEQLPHGEWLPWLREKVDFSERSAQDFMRLAKEYGKSAEIADLGASKALALLALPDSERAGFLAEKHAVNGEEKSVADMTAAELKKAIRERDEARERVRTLEESIDEQQRTYDVDLETARAELAAAEQSRKKMAEDVAFLNERVAGLTEEVSDRDRELEALRSRPVDVAVQEPDPEVLDQIREEGAKAAREALGQELEKARASLSAAQAKEKEAKETVKELKERVAQAEKAAKQARDDAERAKKEAGMAADKDMAAFAILFEQTQGMVNKMAETMRKMEREGRGEDAGKLRRAMKALAQAVDAAADGK